MNLGVIYFKTFAAIVVMSFIFAVSAASLLRLVEFKPWSVVMEQSVVAHV